MKSPPVHTLLQDLVAPPATYPPNLLERLVAWTRLPWRGAALPQAGLRHPRARWAVTVALTLAGGILLSLPFLPPVRLLTPDRLLLNGALLLGGLLFLTWGGIPLALLGRFRIARAFGLILLALLIGTLGYYKLEGWPLLDSLYMTVITMTTIGFGEIRPLSESGRIFTIVLSLAAVGIAGYAITTVATFVLEGDLQRMLRGRRTHRHRHAGAGRGAAGVGTRPKPAATWYHYALRLKKPWRGGCRRLESGYVGDIRA